MKKIIVLMILAISAFALNTTSLLQAKKEADALYKKTKNVYKPIEILRKENIDEAVENKPALLTAKQYADLLYDYAYLLVHTADDTHRHINQQNAEKILLQAKKYAPNDTKIQLLLAQSYLMYFKFSVRTEFGWGVDHYPHDESWRTTLPPLLKQAYIEYVTLCKTKNIQPQLTDEEWLIVKRQRLFIEYYSTFSKEQPKYGGYHKPYKKGFENICKEYVTQLNQMPDDKYLQCSRYVVDGNGLFTIKPIVTMDWRKQINFYLVTYKGESLLDNYGSLYLKKDNDHSCTYQYVDFNLTLQIRNSDDCRYKLEKHFFKNQDTNITNKKDN